MSTVESVSIISERSSFFAKIRPLFLWGYLVGAEWASHWLFGGSWVIDILVIAMLIAMAAGGIVKLQGTSVSMTRREIRAWVEDGMPSEAKQWLERFREGPREIINR